MKNIIIYEKFSMEESYLFTQFRTLIGDMFFKNSNIIGKLEQFYNDEDNNQYKIILKFLYVDTKTFNQIKKMFKSLKLKNLQISPDTLSRVAVWLFIKYDELKSSFTNLKNFTNDKNLLKIINNCIEAIDHIETNRNIKKYNL